MVCSGIEGGNEGPEYRPFFLPEVSCAELSAFFCASGETEVEASVSQSIEKINVQPANE